MFDLIKKAKNKFFLKKGLESGVYIISFPKSGRTWLRMLLGKAVCRKYGLDENLMVNTYKLTGAAGISPVIFTHDDSSIKHGHRHDRLETDKSRYRNQKVIFLIRDPRDVIVSCYFQPFAFCHSGPLAVILSVAKNL